MQLINKQYKVMKINNEDRYGNTVVVEDTLRKHFIKKMRIINLQKETQDFIEYMKCNLYDYRGFNHPNLVEFFFFNKIITIDAKPIIANKYYFTYDYFNGDNIFEATQKLDFDMALDIAVQLCAVVKYLHLRGFLLCNINANELQVIYEKGKMQLKVSTIPYVEGTDSSIMFDKDNNYFKSPETFQTGKYTRASDVYLIGSIMFHIFSREHIEESNFREALADFDPEKGSKLWQMKNIIRKCTEFDLGERYSAVEEIVKDINKLFDKQYNIIDKKYIQTLPKYPTKLVSRENYLKKVVNNAKGRLFENKSTKAVLLKGGMGTGKNVFMTTLKYRLEQEGIIVSFTKVQENTSTNFNLIVAILKEIMTHLDKEILDRYASDLSYVMPEVLDASEVPVCNTVLKQEDKVRLIYRLGNLLQEASARHPFAMLINCFENIDQDSFEVLNYIMKSEGKGSVYAVVSIDTGNAEENENLRSLYSSLSRAGTIDVIELGNFNISETAEYIRLLLGMDKAPLDFATNIFKETEGNPSYIYEIIYLLFNNNYIYVNDDGEWVLNNVDFSNINLSFNIDEIILNKISKLDSLQSEIIKIISVFNTAVSSDILESMLTVKGEELFSLLNELSAINILSRKVDDWGISFDFSSINLRKSIYESISKEEKLKYHERVSYILESKFLKENRENKDELIYHMTKANRYQEAIDYLLSAAQKMIESNLINQAIQFLEQTYNLFEKEEVCSKKVNVCIQLGDLYAQMGEYNRAMYFYDIVENMASHTMDKKILVDINIKKFSLLYKLDDIKGCLDYAIRAKKILKTIDYPEGLYELVINLNDLMNFRRKYNSYLKIMEKILEVMSEGKYDLYYARILIVYGRILNSKTKYEESLHVLLESVVLLEKLAAYRYIPEALNNIGNIYLDHFNDLSKAKEYYEKNLSISQKTNDLSIMLKSYNNLAEIFRIEDRYKECMELYNKALEVVRITKNSTMKSLIIINCSLTNTAMEDYKKSADALNEAESFLNSSKNSGSMIAYLYEAKAEFFYNVGYYELSTEYAQKCLDMCISWGITEIAEARLYKILSDIMLTDETNFNDEVSFCRKVLEDNFYKNGRVACVKFAQIYAEKGMLENARMFLSLGISYVPKIDTDMLRVEYEYATALISEGREKLNRLMELVPMLDTIEANEIKWKVYNAIAQQLFEDRSYHEALKYLISALNFLRRLVHNVPDEYKVKFVMSHNRHSIKDSLVKISELLTSKKGNIMGKRFMNYHSSEINLLNIDKYFDYTDFREIYRFRELDGKTSGQSLDTSSYNKFLFKVQELITKFTEDNAANLKNMINLFAEITQAKNAFIATVGEDDSLNILSSYTRYNEIPFYKYVIDQAKQKRDNIIITDAFEYNRKKGDILIPKDITAVFCIPIMFAGDDDNLDVIDERRRYRPIDNDCAIGYIYLDTDSIINNFTKESSHFCKLASKIAYVLVDNYNLKIVSSIDKLTKLYTRKYFESALQIQMNYAEKDGGEFVIIMIDIDKFKSVNDRFGHQKGDEILQNVSSIIMNSVRKGDVCARYGGEEIIVLLPGANAEEGFFVAEKMRKKVENAKLLGLHNPLTISLGVSSYPEHSTWAKDLIEKADQALYHAKESGRNMSCSYQSDMSKTLKRVDKLAGIISGNLVEDQRRVETMLEILDLQRNSSMKFNDKLFNFLGRVIEVSEAHTGIIFLVDDDKSIIEKIGRKKLVDTLVGDVFYNASLVEKCIESQVGEHLIDWSNYPGTDQVTGMPDWQSIILLPFVNSGKLRGILYLSVPIKNKEFDASAFNFIKTLCDIISLIY